MKTLILLLFAGVPLFAQAPVCGIMVPNPANGGKLDCIGGAGAALSYCAPVSASGTAYTCAPSPPLSSYSTGECDT